MTQMGFINWLKGWWRKLFKSEAVKEFGVDIILSDKMERAIKQWERTWKGMPEWKSDKIKTINFAKAIASEVARLVTLAINVKVEGSARAEYLQGQIDSLLPKIREYVEKGTAYGGVILKPNEDGIDCLTPNNFLITEVDGNGNITGALFFDYIEKGETYYTRIEYHRFMYGNDESRIYAISNRAYKSRTKEDIGKKIKLSEVPEWKGLEPDLYGSNIDKPLFSYFGMPATNNVDIDSPLKMSIFSDAMKELKDLDIAYTMMSDEIEDSQHITFFDSMMVQYAEHNHIELPRFVQPIDMGTDTDGNKAIHEHVPTVITDDRKIGINLYLSFIGYKCGFSNGYFVFNEKTGMATATQIESEDQRTIQLIKDIRDALESTMDRLLYAMDKMADAYSVIPPGVYKVSYNFMDVTFNHEENLITMKNDAINGLIPKWMYVKEQYHLSDEEAKRWVEEAKNENEEKGVFANE